MGLFAELKRRSVFKVAAAYLVIGWLVIQVGAVVAPQLGLPAWASPMVTLLVLLGFPVALVLAWAFELTPEGFRPTEGAVGNKRFYASVILLTVLGIAGYWYAHRGPLDAHDAADPRSIAVLPFVNMSGDPGNDYFSDGISEQLLNTLAQIPDLKVAARTSAFQFKGHPEDVTRIGQLLHVSHLLEGSVRRDGNQVRITAQLIDTRNGYHVWSKTYQREFTDIFAVQDDISSQIARALQATLAPTDNDPTSDAPDPAPAAYNYYLRGRALLARRGADNLRQAMLAFDNAIAKDPNYSAAYSGRAFATFLQLPWRGEVTLREVTRKALGLAQAAIHLDPDNAEAYMVRGIVEAQQPRRYAQAAADMRKALALAPGSVDVLNMYADFYDFTGALGKAEKLKRRAMELDPLAWVHPLNLAQILEHQGRWSEAMELTRRAISLGGEQFARDQLIYELARTGRLEEANQVLQTLCKDPPAPGTCLRGRVIVFGLGGQLIEARKFYRQLTAPTGPRDGQAYRPSELTALRLRALNDVPGAIESLTGAVEDPDVLLATALLTGPAGAQLPEEISTNPQWLALWNDPRIAPFMQAYRANLVAWRNTRKSM
jgi:TolB-like protein/Flp pilus assembly protein TadD